MSDTHNGERSNSGKSNNDKRQFTRVPFVSHIHLSQTGDHWQSQVVDVSLKGILIDIDSQQTINTESPVNAVIRFENESEIQATMTLSHHNGRLHGFQFTEMDSDSISHLRNLITHNVGNTEACDRELMTLFRYHQ